MKKRVFIIHGWGGNPNEAWQAWIREELEKKGYEVVAPQIPNAEEPKMEEWIPFVSDLVGEPDENTFFIGHSIGCQTIMRYLEKIYPQKIGGVVFVAGWFNLVNLSGPNEERIAKPWIEAPIDFEKVKSATKNILVLLSDNDRWVPLSDKEIFEEKLGAKVIVKHLGHFTEDDPGADKLPDVMEFFGKL